MLIGATAGIEDDDERARRATADDDDSPTRIEAIGVEAFLDEWLRQSAVRRPRRPATAQRADRLRNTAAGLASSLRSTGTGTQEPLWERLGEIDMPVLILAGERRREVHARSGGGSRARCPAPGSCRSPARATPSISSAPQPTADALISRLAALRHDSAEDQADRGEQAVGQLQAAGGAEDGDEVPAVTHRAAPP